MFNTTSNSSKSKHEGFKYALQRLRAGEQIIVEPHWSNDFLRGIGQALQDALHERQTAPKPIKNYIVVEETGLKLFDHFFAARQAAENTAVNESGSKILVAQVMGYALDPKPARLYHSIYDSSE